MILVTGAAGKTGQAVLTTLATRGEAVRALVHRQDQVDPAKQLGAQEAIVADLLDPAEMRVAMGGIRAVYLIVSNMHPEETRVGEIAIAAAKDAGVERIVYHSVLHPQTREMPHHWQKLTVEELLFGSGLGFTILQPAAYMQNVLPYWKEILEDGVYRVPYGESGALSLVDLEDVAQVSARVLIGEEHSGAIYELAGPEALTPRQIAAVLSKRLKKSVRSEMVPLETWMEGARAGGLVGYPLDSLTKMFGYYDRHGLIGNPKVLEMLLGRQSTTFDRFIERIPGFHEPLA